MGSRSHLIFFEWQCTQESTRRWRTFCALRMILGGSEPSFISIIEDLRQACASVGSVSIETVCYLHEDKGRKVRALGTVMNHLKQTLTGKEPPREKSNRE